jgi:hypothetical protein
MEEAIPFYLKLIERHHEALLAGDIEKARRETTVRTERKIYLLALVLRMLSPDAYKDGISHERQHER